MSLALDMLLHLHRVKQVHDLAELLCDLATDDHYTQLAYKLQTLLPGTSLSSTRPLSDSLALRCTIDPLTAKCFVVRRHYQQIPWNTAQGPAVILILSVPERYGTHAGTLPCLAGLPEREVWPLRREPSDAEAEVASLVLGVREMFSPEPRAL